MGRGAAIDPLPFLGARILGLGVRPDEELRLGLGEHPERLSVVEELVFVVRIGVFHRLVRPRGVEDAAALDQGDVDPLVEEEPGQGDPGRAGSYDTDLCFEGVSVEIVLAVFDHGYRRSSLTCTFLWPSELLQRRTQKVTGTLSGLAPNFHIVWR